jgi:hypothetical protein
MTRGTRARRAGVVAERRNMNYNELGKEFPAVRRTFEDYGTGEKELEAILQHTERAVPTGTAPQTCLLRLVVQQRHCRWRAGVVVSASRRAGTNRAAVHLLSCSLLRC